MDDVIKGIIIGLIPSLIVSILTARITVNLSIRQFRSQRWWERKADMYSELIKHLSIIQYCYGEWINDELMEYRKSDKEKQKISKLYRESLDEFIMKCNESAYIVSEKAHNALENIKREIEWEETTLNWFEDADNRYALVKETIRELREYAREDLNVVEM